MVAPIQTPASPPAPTRPRLQALNQDAPNLSEWIRQATYIIGLPDGWESLTDDARSTVARHQVRARADWVLRWILEKLKVSADGGAQARANVKAWKLIDFMIEILPVSRCAPYLRDADFLSILEKALEESFGVDAVIQPDTTPQRKLPPDASDSSETVQEDPQPTRKRKRASSPTVPPKSTVVESGGSIKLFEAVRTVVRSIRDKSDARGTSEARIQSEHMKMVLRTESAQAARILKNWLNAVQRLFSTEQGSGGHLEYLDLALIVDIWELRTIDPKHDSGASVEQFSTECLIPSLHLSQILHQAALDHPTYVGAPFLSDVALVLDRLVAKHILVPSRTAFFDDLDDQARKDSKSTYVYAEHLLSNLEPLRAKLLQAAQIQDSGEAIPAYFASLFAAVPHLLGLIIRCSPARTPKARAAEKPWMHASLIALAQCVGCSLEPPEFAAPSASIASFEKCLAILAAHDVIIDTQILRDLFWFHSGLKYPLNQKRVINWSFIADMVKIDSSIFLPDPKTAVSAAGDRPSDLAAFLFGHISSNFAPRETPDGEPMEIDDDDHADQGAGRSFAEDDAVKSIIVPILFAFSRNRQLLGFFDHWDHELCKTALADRDSLAELEPWIWEDRGIVFALAETFEKSLTVPQISTLFRNHAERLAQYTKKQPKQALSSAVIIKAVLRSIRSDEIIEVLRPDLLSVWKTYESWVQQDRSNHPSALGLAWTSLCLLMGHLWPIHFHQSAAAQNEFVRPLLERATKDVSSAQKEEPNRRLHSSCRAAAIMFVFVACEYLSTLPDTAQLIEKRLQKTLKAILPGNMEEQDLCTTLELFCVNYAQLLAFFEPVAAQEMLSRLLETVSAFDEQQGIPIVQTLSRSIFEGDSATLASAFASALLNGLEQDDALRTSSIHAFLQMSALSLSREQREVALDKLLALVISSPQYATPLLDIMIVIMEVPNATSKLSSDASAFFDIAQALHESGTEIPPIPQRLRTLVASTLGHLFPNRNQAQNKLFFESYGKKIKSLLKKPKQCSAVKLAILTGTLLPNQDMEFVLPLVQYVDFLSAVLKSTEARTSIPMQIAVLDAYNQIPLSFLRKDSELIDTTQASLREWALSSLPFEDLVKLPIEKFPVEAWPSVFGAIAKYQLYSNLERLLRASTQLLVDEQGDHSILAWVREAVLPLENSEKLNLTSFFLRVPNTVIKPAVAYQLLDVVISTMDDKQEVEPQVKAQEVAILPQICSLLGENSDSAAFNALLDGVNTILLDKPNMVSQHNIECLLTVLHGLSTRSSPRLSSVHAPAIYRRLCDTTRLVLLLHRSRLGGRFHLLLPLLQSLLLCLFMPNANRGAALPPWLDSPSSSEPTRLTPANAAQYTHLLSTLCSPTQSSVQRTRSATTLNDPIKAAREYASQYVYPLLSAFCRFLLYGRLDGDVRGKLMPGIWEVVALARMDEGSIDAMFAGLGKAERDIWRGIWGEWVRVKGRKEKKGKEEKQG